MAKTRHILASFLLLAALTYIDSRLVPVNNTTVVLTFLLVILGVAARWGLVVAVFASVVGMMSINFFFLPPIGTLTIADPSNWVALFSFLVTAIVASQLSTSARKRTEEALSRQHEMERLYEFSRLLMLSSAQKGLAGEVPYRVAQALGAESAAFFDRHSGKVYRSGPVETSLPDSKLIDLAVQGTVVHDDQERLLLMPVSLGGHVIGSLAIHGGTVSEAGAHALANLVAIALEREAAQESASRAEAAQENEKLKSTLLDALAHEFKTPLTSIKAAATALLVGSQQSSAQTELLTVVDEETDRLTAMVTEAIRMARIEAGKVQLQKQPVVVATVVNRSLQNLKDRLDAGRITVNIAPGIPPVQADEELVALALQQLVDNALKYSPPKSPLTISVQLEDGSVVLSVADHGTGIPEHELDRIFEKFYRSSAHLDHTSGTGMGLTIAREIVQAHGGRIWVRSQWGQGSTFSFSLPLAATEVSA